MIFQWGGDPLDAGPARAGVPHASEPTGGQPTCRRAEVGLLAIAAPFVRCQIECRRRRSSFLKQCLRCLLRFNCVLVFSDRLSCVEVVTLLRSRSPSRGMDTGPRLDPRRQWSARLPRHFLPHTQLRDIPRKTSGLSHDTTTS